MSREKDFDKTWRFFSRLYKIWIGMKERCLNPNATFYKNYGGRGINVCQQWMSYPTFKKWAMSHGYEEHLTIERINVDGSYSPKIANGYQKHNKLITEQTDFLGMLLTP
jgi:hypothetical protein